jgi:hypothetical protein
MITFHLWNLRSMFSNAIDLSFAYRSICLLAVSGLQLWLSLPLTTVVMIAIGLGVVLYPTTSCSVELPCSPLRLAVSLPVSILLGGCRHCASSCCQSAVLLVEVDECPVVAEVRRGYWCGCCGSRCGENSCGDDGFGFLLCSVGRSSRPGVCSLMRK